jgi:voltage-gated potassium channel
MRIIADVMRDKKSDLIVTMSVTAIILLLASTFMYEIEHSVQPDQFPNIFSTIWWAVATLTTIGYGDVYPITALGRLLAGITAVLGIGIVAIPTGIISAGFMEKFQQQTDKTNVIEEEPKEATKTYYCPKCGTIFTVLDEDEPQKP